MSKLEVHVRSRFWEQKKPQRQLKQKDLKKKKPKNYKYELTEIWIVQGTSKQTNIDMFKNDVTFIELFLVPIYLTLYYITFSIPKWRIKFPWKIKFLNPISL